LAEDRGQKIRNRGERAEIKGIRNSVLFALSSSLFAMLVVSAHAEQRNIEDMLKNHLLSNYPWKTIEINNIKADGRIPAEPPVEIKAIKGPLGNATFVLESKNAEKVLVHANVAAFDEVVKSKRALKKGQILREDDVYVDMADVTRVTGGAVRNFEEIIGKPLKRSIIANVIVMEDMIEKNLVVNKDTRIMLIIESPGFIITAAGKLKEKGYVGAPVKAINLSSKKEVIGELISENTVKVEF